MARNLDVEDRRIEIRSMKPEEALDALDLDRPGLEAVRAALESGGRESALTALRDYYRGRYPVKDEPQALSEKELATAEGIVRHVIGFPDHFPYEPVDYGPEIDWAADPHGDIEWVARVQRFYWADVLARAWRATRDEKFAAGFVELSSDWIDKHPLEEFLVRPHPVYRNWTGYPWLDIQTGIRARMLCRAFCVLVHSESFTPAFLEKLLASLHDHQAKTMRLPRRTIHNKSLMEMRGFVDVAHTFREFRELTRWLDFAAGRSCEHLLGQVTPDGVQREWCGTYHTHVLGDGEAILWQMRDLGREMPEDYTQRLRAMNDYLFGSSTPELSYPMFGDTWRPERTSPDRSTWPLYRHLVEASAKWNDPKYAALARLERDKLPTQLSYAYRDAGLYAMRNDWGPEAIYFALHCPPPGISNHDQPDNGTFELYAYGRWLMTDSGFYTYGLDKEARRWHRQTRVHQTLTLDGQDAAIDGRQLLWWSEEAFDCAVVENPSYERLTHRRSVWFVGRSFFVLMDEAIGDAPGAVELNFQFAPGEIDVDGDNNAVTTRFEDANVLLWAGPDALVTLAEEPGWHAWAYNRRRRRKSIRLTHAAAAPVVFVTVLVPRRGSDSPGVRVEGAVDVSAGDERAELMVEVDGNQYRVGRDLASEQAWVERTA